MFQFTLFLLYSIFFSESLNFDHSLLHKNVNVLHLNMQRTTAKLCLSRRGCHRRRSSLVARLRCRIRLHHICRCHRRQRCRRRHHHRATLATAAAVAETVAATEYRWRLRCRSQYLMWLFTLHHCFVMNYQ